MKIDEAENKPTQLLINYASVRPAELRELYHELDDRTPGANNQIRADTLTERFAPRGGNGFEDDHLQDCLRFMTAIDMIYRPEDRVIELINNDVMDVSFEPRLLAHLRTQDEKQSHLSRVHDVALSEFEQTTTIDELLPAVKRELEFDMTWNVTKLRMWGSLAKQVGLISWPSNEEIVLSPVRSLLHELLAEYDRQNESKDLADALQWIETHFLDVFSMRAGTPEVHPAMSDVLRNMADDNAIELRGMADAQNEVRLPSTGAHPQQRTVKRITVKETPDRPAAYRYPLDQRPLEVSQ